MWRFCRLLYVFSMLLNPIIKNVASNKICKETEDKICLYYNPITKTLKQNPKLNMNRYKAQKIPTSYHIKEFHRKDHHHRLDKYVAYNISVIALNRLEESTKLLGLPFYFPRIIKEINNHTYQIEHIGLQSDQIEIQVGEDVIKKQAKQMRRILEYAGVIHLDFEPHCKNIVFNDKTKRLGLIDWDIVAIKSKGIPIEGAKKIWVDEQWYPNIYEDRFLDLRGWDNVEQRMFDAMKACMSPVCICRSRELS